MIRVAGGVLTASPGATDASCRSWSVFLQTCPPNRRWQKPVAATGSGWATSTCAASCSSALKPSPLSAIWMTSVCWRILRVKARSSPSTSRKKNPVKEVNYAAVVMAFWSFPGVEPQTLDEWKLLIQLSQLHSSEVDSEQVNGSSWSNGSENSGRKVNPESLTLMLARTAGPDPAIGVLEECGVQPVLSPASKLVFELLRVTEKRQRWVGGTK